MYSVTKAEIELLEQVDKMLLHDISDCSRNFSWDLLYLEYGIIPISFIVKIRKLMCLHHILHQKEDSLIYIFFFAQLGNPTRGYWDTEVLKDMEDLNINKELEDIKNIPRQCLES